MFPASFDKTNTKPDNIIYDNNVRDVSEENDNIDLDYSEEENDENIIINTDDQLSESKIAILSELYKSTEKKPRRSNTTSFKVISVTKGSTKNRGSRSSISASFTHC